MGGKAANPIVVRLLVKALCRPSRGPSMGQAIRPRVALAVGRDQGGWHHRVFDARAYGRGMGALGGRSWNVTERKGWSEADTGGHPDGWLWLDISRRRGEEEGTGCGRSHWRGIGGGGKGTGRLFADHTAAAMGPGPHGPGLY